MDSSNPPQTFEIRLEHRNGTNLRTAMLHWARTATDLKIWNSSGAYTTIDSSFTQVAGNHVWTKLKFVVDFSTQYYARAMYGDKTYDASAVQCQSAGGGTPPGLDVTIEAIGNGVANAICWVDDFVLTNNEP
jgi:uncharacterized protein (DUF1330 family)